MNTHALFQGLEAALPALKGSSDWDFAKSLYDQFVKYGRWSDKQTPWVEKMIARAQQKQAPKIEGINLTGITQLFQTAVDHGVKHPKITIQVNGIEMTLSRAGDHSRNPGFIYVCQGEDYRGKVSPLGVYLGNDAVVPALKALSADPTRTAALHGQVTGACCFCNRKLTTGESIAVGYGPDCADHYGLPWGDRKASTQFKAQGPVQVEALPAKPAPAPKAPKVTLPGDGFVEAFVVSEAERFSPAFINAKMGVKKTGQIDPDLNDDIPF
jgi:hypothetical protein